ncbi:hypothetical protein AR679_gp057 [Yellowstone lake phycodnavirus 1]|uniref:hypothetical protein n=1 Tax=Yellowstone lake phycodnavirus 1 TaxID=1586713 RepID=UPI0006EBBAB9|nr:hypothetical protein AR679_gp057 [Yellowstone lake phycodnavirus 1]BAT22083.1 hypothetical protein [Yellowstone lake phycodnavirus 1]
MSSCECNCADAEEQYVKVQGSDVYFYCEVNELTIRELIMKLRALELDLLKKYLDLNITTKPVIRLFIRSDGGDIFAGWSGMDAIQSMKRVKVRTIADGCCASAATFLLLGGYSRHMTENSYVLIHQLNTDGVWGKYEEIKDHVNNFDMYMKRFRQIYANYTKLPEKKLKKLMKRDLFLDATSCLKWDVVDSILL